MGKLWGSPLECIHELHVAVWGSTELLSITSSYRHMHKAIVFSSKIRQLIEVVRHFYWIRDLPLASRLLCFAASMSYILHFRIRLCILSFEVQIMHDTALLELVLTNVRSIKPRNADIRVGLILSFLLSWTGCESLDKSWGFIGCQ